MVNTDRALPQSIAHVIHHYISSHKQDNNVLSVEDACEELRDILGDMPISKDDLEHALCREAIKKGLVLHFKGQEKTSIEG